MPEDRRGEIGGVMLKRTWPYGTRKSVSVRSVDHGRNARVSVVTCTDSVDPREGYILVLAADRVIEADVKPNQLRQIIFRSGGPTGGHWDFLNQSELIEQSDR